MHHLLPVGQATSMEKLLLQALQLLQALNRPGGDGMTRQVCKHLGQTVFATAAALKGRAHLLLTAESLVDQLPPCPPAGVPGPAGVKGGKGWVVMVWAGCWA